MKQDHMHKLLYWEEKHTELSHLQMDMSNEKTVMTTQTTQQHHYQSDRTTGASEWSKFRHTFNLQPVGLSAVSPRPSWTFITRSQAVQESPFSLKVSSICKDDTYVNWTLLVVSDQWSTSYICRFNNNKPFGYCQLSPDHTIIHLYTASHKLAQNQPRAKSWI